MVLEGSRVGLPLLLSNEVNIRVNSVENQASAVGTAYS